MKKKIGFAAGVLAVVLLVGIPVYAAGEPVIYNSYMDGEQIHLYVGNIEQTDNVTCQIGNSKCEDVSVNTAIETETYILADNSLSIDSSYRDTIRQVLEKLVQTGSEKENFTIATFDTQLHYLIRNSSDGEELLRTVEGIAYENLDTNVTDVMYALLKELESSPFDGLRRIILISDGAEYSSIGYTEQELRAELQELAYPVYTVGCTYRDNTKELETMFSMSRLTGGEQIWLDEVKDADAIIETLNTYKNTVQVSISIPESLRDGSSRGIKLEFQSGGEKESVSTTKVMPFLGDEEGSESIETTDIEESTDNLEAEETPEITEAEKPVENTETGEPTEAPAGDSDTVEPAKTLSEGTEESAGTEEAADKEEPAGAVGTTESVGTADAAEIVKPTEIAKTSDTVKITDTPKSTEVLTEAPKDVKMEEETVSAAAEPSETVNEKEDAEPTEALESSEAAGIAEPTKILTEEAKPTGTEEREISEAAADPTRKASETETAETEPSEIQTESAEKNDELKTPLLVVLLILLVILLIRRKKRTQKKDGGQRRQGKIKNMNMEKSDTYFSGDETSFNNDETGFEDSDTCFVDKKNEETRFEGERTLFMDEAEKAGESMEAADFINIRLTDMRNPTRITEVPLSMSVSLGRNAKENQVVFDYEKSVSAKHCEIFRTDDRIFVRDLNSTNGTWVDDEKVEHERELYSGSVLKMGRLEVVFEVIDR